MDLSNLLNDNTIGTIFVKNNFSYKSGIKAANSTTGGINVKIDNDGTNKFVGNLKGVQDNDKLNFLVLNDKNVDISLVGNLGNEDNDEISIDCSNIKTNTNTAKIDISGLKYTKSTIVSSAGTDNIKLGNGTDQIKIAENSAGTSGNEKIIDFDLTKDKLLLSTTILIGDKDSTNIYLNSDNTDDYRISIKDGVINYTKLDNATYKIENLNDLIKIFETFDSNNTYEVGLIELNGNSYVLIDKASGDTNKADNVIDSVKLE